MDHDKDSVSYTSYVTYHTGQRRCSVFCSNQHQGVFLEEYFEDSLKSLDTDYVDLVSFDSRNV